MTDDNRWFDVWQQALQDAGSSESALVALSKRVVAAEDVAQATLEFAALIDKIGGKVMGYPAYFHMCIVLDAWLKERGKK